MSWETVPKVPSTAAAFPRCTAKASRCFRKEVDLGSPETIETRLPNSFTKARPNVPHEPSVSIAMGTNSCEVAKAAYLDCFFDSAKAAAAPDSSADLFTYEGANVSGHVASQRRHLPFDHGIRVAPPGRLESERISPGGYRSAATLAL